MESHAVGAAYRAAVPLWAGKKVVIFNIQQQDSLDQNIVDLMYERIERVVDDLAQVQAHEYHEGLKSEILGDLAESLDIEHILQEGALFATLLRWQTPLGLQQRQEFAVVQVQDGVPSLNAKNIDRWLLTPPESAALPQDKDRSHKNYLLARNAAQERLARLSNQHLIPQSIEWLAAGWVEGG